VFIKNGTQTSVTFNGTGSDKMNWFAAEKVINSPWPDQANMSTSNMFYHEKRWVFKSRLFRIQAKQIISPYKINL
jgi:hypothetical protein